MYKLKDVYKTFPSGCTEDYKILRAFEMGKQEGGAKVKELEAQIEKMKCCGNCIHCKYDENEESYEFCEKHQQVVNVVIVPCSEWKGR
jgi:hypothetical protein